MQLAASASSFLMDLLKSSSMGSCAAAGLRDFFFLRMQLP